MWPHGVVVDPPVLDDRAGDFRTDLKQSRDAEVISEIQHDFGLPEGEGN